MPLLEFTVPGDPVTQGSMTAFPYLETCTDCKPGRPCAKRNCWHGRVARARVAHDDDGKMKSWRQFVAAHAVSAMNAQRWPSRPAFADGAPVVVGAVFDLVRPAGHYLGGGGLSAEGKRYPYPTREHSGDVDKLLRAINDALTGALWSTDAQVIAAPPAKRWAPGRPRQGMTRIIAGRADDMRAIFDQVCSYFGASTTMELF